MIDHKFCVVDSTRPDQHTCPDCGRKLALLAKDHQDMRKNTIADRIFYKEMACPS